MPSTLLLSARSSCVCSACAEQLCMLSSCDMSSSSKHTRQDSHFVSRSPHCSVRNAQDTTPAVHCTTPTRSTARSPSAEPTGLPARNGKTPWQGGGSGGSLWHRQNSDPAPLSVPEHKPVSSGSYASSKYTTLQVTFLPMVSLCPLLQGLPVENGQSG